MHGLVLFECMINDKNCDFIATDVLYILAPLNELGLTHFINRHFYRHDKRGNTINFAILPRIWLDGLVV